MALNLWAKRMAVSAFGQRDREMEWAFPNFVVLCVFHIGMVFQSPFGLNWLRFMLIAFHKPFGVLSQFTGDGSANRTLAEFGFPAGVYPIGRLDADSEGLLLLSDERELNARLLPPSRAHPRVYWAQVEGVPSEETLRKLSQGWRCRAGEHCLAGRGCWTRLPRCRRASRPSACAKPSRTVGLRWNWWKERTARSGA